MIVCERCGGKKSSRKNRYCGKCRIAVVREMIDSGYLVPVSVMLTKPRPSGSQEDTAETKFGVD